jgi:hypothetical protein
MFANSQPIKSEQTVWLAPNPKLRHVEKVANIEIFVAIKTTT